jgi:long-chain acyl-CoA synthetase
MPSRSLTAAV